MGFLDLDPHPCRAGAGDHPAVGDADRLRDPAFRDTVAEALLGVVALAVLATGRPVAYELSRTDEFHLGVDAPPEDYGTGSWRQEAGATVVAAMASDSDHFGHSMRTQGCWV